MATNNDALIDANTQHQLFVIQVQEREAQKAFTVVSQARDAILKELGSTTTISTKKELQRINRKLEKRLTTIYRKWPDEIQRGQREFLKEEYRFQKNTLSEAIQGKQEVKVPTQKEALSAVQNTPMNVGARGAAVSLGQILKQFPKREAKLVTDRITAGFFNGETPTDIARAISGTNRNRFRDGLLNITRSRAQTTAKTGITHLQEQAKQTFYNENDDLVKEYKIVATLDSRTSSICQGLDGRTYSVKGNNPKPPFHFNCRSTTSPVLDDAFRVDTNAKRPSSTGKVGAGKTYPTWLKDQPADFQDKALGPEKGLIFRNAGLSPKEFQDVSLNKFRQPRTIQEMAAEDDRIKDYLKGRMNE